MPSEDKHRTAPPGWGRTLQEAEARSRCNLIAPRYLRSLAERGWRCPTTRGTCLMERTYGEVSILRRRDPRRGDQVQALWQRPREAMPCMQAGDQIAGPQ